MAERRILNSWKEIANYLGRGVRTVQRWEAQLGLPVHRPAGKEHSAVLAFSSELDQWLDSRPLRHNPDLQAPSPLLDDLPAAELHALVIKAETVLEKLDILLSRGDEMYRKLGDVLEDLTEGHRRELRNGRTRRAEAGAA